MKYLTHWATALITLALVSFIGWSDPYLKQTARLKSFDLIQQYDETENASQVAIVEIDEKAIEKHGQWPWSRETLGNLVWDLHDAGARVVMLPILFSEPDRFGQDEYFAGSLTGGGTVIAQTGTTQTNKNAVKRGVAKIGDPMPWLYEWPGMLGPIEILGMNAGGVGVINTAPEIDGVVRRVPLIMKVGDQTYPSMGMEAIRVATGDPSYQIKTEQGGIRFMRVPKYKPIQTDPFGRIWLRWNKQFQTTSASGTIEDYKKFAGKWVIIALTAEGLANIVATPKGEMYSHMPVALTTQTMIDGDNLIRLPEATFYEFVTALGIGLLLILVANKLPYWLTGILIIVIPTASVYGSYWYFINELQLWDWSWIVFVSTVVGFHAVFNRFVKEFFEKQKIKKQFAGYCSPTVVKLLQENPALIKEGVKKDVSVMFSDLRGFTPIGEHFGDDVKGLGDYMNGYMDCITQPILDHDGMVIKYVGDASMHIQGAPIDDEKHAFHIVETGLQMLDAVDAYTKEAEANGLPPAAMGFGVNSGEGFIGEMGSSKRHSYDILGDMVSTAARLEARCKAYGMLCIIGAETYRRTKDDFFYLYLDNLQPKGKSSPDFIYTALRIKNDNKQLYNEQKALHDKMHKLYKAQQFDTVIKMCKGELKGLFDGQMDKYYDIWVERCELMKTQKLPKNWNGAFVATSK